MDQTKIKEHMSSSRRSRSGKGKRKSVDTDPDTPAKRARFDEVPALAFFNSSTFYFSPDPPFCPFSRFTLHSWLYCVWVCSLYVEISE